MPRGWLPAHLALALLLTVLVPVASASTPSTTDIARLSRPLATALAALGGRAGVSVVDVTHGTRYAYNPTGRFIVASTIKVSLAMAAYERSRRTGVPLTAGERDRMTDMLEWSDNTAASYFYATIGGASGLAAYLRRIGVSGWAPYAPHPASWGWSSVNPVTGSRILEKLWRGQAGITSAARSRILYLMRHVTSSQRWGVGDTAPAGSTVAVKDGWVVGPDGHWAVNSTGIVVAPGHTWIVTIYTRANSGYSAGVTIVRKLARLVAAGVLAH
jgi:beta-lactamase class A